MRIRTYKYYLIDLDRTLWNFDANSERAIRHLIEECADLYEGITGIEKGNDPLHSFFLKYDVLNHKLWHEYESGRLSKDNLRWRRFYDAFLLYGIDDEELARKFGEDYLDRMILEKELMPGAMEMLQNISRAGGRMALLSNGFKEVQYHKLSRSGIDHFFTTVVISDEVGCQKPDSGIFRYALEKLSGLSPESDPEGWEDAKRDTLMIGDDPANDITGACNFGIDSYFYNNRGFDNDFGATYVSSTLDSFKED